MSDDLRINSRVKIIDKTLNEKFNIPNNCVGRVTRLYYDHVTIEFIINEQRTTINAFINQIKSI